MWSDEVKHGFVVAAATGQDEAVVALEAGNLTASPGARTHGVHHIRKPRRDRVNSRLTVLLHVRPSPCASRDARVHRAPDPRGTRRNTLQTCHEFSLTDADCVCQ